jgi:hypothetical protein
MRNVLKDRSEVCHVWAHQGQPAGSSGNVSFSGPTLFSYAAPIARLVTAKAGGQVALITTRGYSSTTNGHVSLARRAVSHLTTFSVHDPTAEPRTNRQHFAETITRAIGGIADAKNRVSRAKRHQSATALVQSVNAFCATFGLALFDTIPADQAVDAYVAEHREKERKAALRATKKRQAAEKIARLEQLALADQWKAGASVQLNSNVIGEDFLRIMDDQVETTRSARAPLSHVRKLAPLILDRVAAGEAWEPDRDLRFGPYRLDRITDEGDVIIGCHRFRRSEVERFGALVLSPQLQEA